MFLGVDQSLRGTGLCLLSAEGRVSHLSTVETGDLRGAERLAFIRARVDAVLGSGVLMVAMEGYAYHSVGAVFELGEIGGVLKLLAWDRGINPVVVPPASLKKYATGNSQADKAAMIAAARAAGVPVPDDGDDQADAFFLADVALHLHTKQPPRGRARMEVLRQLSHPPARGSRPRVRRLKNAL
jgi:Holliday junction resolvasome RuvABC endonuclease subunit